MFNAYTRGYADLWLAVIAQALSDAATRSEKPDAQLHKTEAENWISRAGADFRQVCHLALLDPDWVATHCKKILSKEVPYEGYPNICRRDPASSSPPRYSPGRRPGRKPGFKLSEEHRRKIGTSNRKPRLPK